MRLLVIEDDEEMAETVAVGLRQMAVDVALDGPAGLEQALARDYDVVVLDRDLPGMHGDEVCGRLVAARCRSRVLMLTAAAGTADLVDGLGLGADDYLGKPFDFAELVARIGALFRRAQPPIPPALRRCDLVVDTARRPPGGQAGCSTWPRRSSACWRCCCPRKAGPFRPKNSWTGSGTRTLTRSRPP